MLRRWWTSGDIFTQNCDTIRISPIDLTAAEKASAGDWIHVRILPPFTISTGLTLYGTLVVLSERIVENVKACEIRSEIYGASDHCPVMLEIEEGAL